MTSKWLVAGLMTSLVLSRRLPRQELSADDHIDVARSVLTQHNDASRTGAYLEERALTPHAVRVQGMHLTRRIPVPAPIGAQLLYVHGLRVHGKKRNMMLAVTTGNMVVAIDTHAGVVLWVDTLADGEAAGRHYPRSYPSTPVIDPLTQRLYVVYSTKNEFPDFIRPDSRNRESSLEGLDAAFWLAALDLKTGRPLHVRKIEGSTRRSDGTVLTFVAKNHYNRPALLLSRGSIYVAFGPRPKEEEIEYHGWVMRYDSSTLELRGLFCTSPDARRAPSANATVGQGAGIWQGRGGLAADSLGNVFLLTGNARANPARGWFGNSFVKLAPGSDRGLAADGAFSPEGSGRELERFDWDLGSGGPLIIPGTSIVAGGGKTGAVYLVDSKDMRPRQSFQASRDAYERSVAQTPNDTAWSAGPQLRGSLTYWRGSNPEFGYIYVWGARDYVRAYRLSLSKMLVDTAAAARGHRLAPQGTSGIIPGGMLSLSAAGNAKKTGILWATVRHSFGGGYLLAGYDAETLEELWSTTLPAVSHLEPPTVAFGMVMVATRSDTNGSAEIRIYSLDKTAP